MSTDFFWSDARFAWRNVVRRPAFTLLVLLTLALAIGVNSAVFALLDGVLLRPLPYRDPSRLAFLWQTLPSKNVFELEPTPFDYQEWHELKSLASVALVMTDAYTLSGDDNPERVRGARLTASLMPMLGVSPALGRAFATAEDTDGAAPVAILGDGLWRRRFGADPRIIGQSIRVNGVMHTVVGVLPASAFLPGHLATSGELWLPARMTAAERANPISHNYTIVGRLADGVSFQSASREIDTFARRMALEHPNSHANLGARITSVEEQTVRPIKLPLLVVAGGVALLLLVACANAITLLVARAASREHDTAIRSALGASSARLLSLSMMESAIYAALGGGCGLVLGNVTLRALLPLFASSMPPGAAVAVDVRVAVFTAAVSTLLALTFGVVVAAHKPSRLADALKGSARTTTAGGSVVRTRSVLVVAQVALSVVLLAAAGLMLDSVTRLSRVSPGFDAAHVLTFRLSLTGSTYASAAQRIGFADSLTARLASMPGVSAAALTSTIPFGGMRGANGVEIEGRAEVRGEPMIIDQRHVTPDYFSTMRIPIRVGRGLLASDDAQAEPVAVINRTMARKYWPNESPIDRRIRITAGFDAHQWLRIVGLAEDVRHISLSREAVPEMYRPYAQAAVPTFTVVVQAAADPASLAAAARAVVREIDAGLPIYDLRTMSDRVAGSFAQTRGTMMLLLVTALLAATLAAVAIYGSIWYAVSQRIPEIGVRLALGASRASVCASVIGRALRLTGIGAAAGTAIALASSSLLKGLLFETPPSNPATFAIVIVGILTLTLAACVAPARRAMSVDPIAALRNE